MQAVKIIYYAILLLMIVSLWIVLKKADRPGVAAIIPIWNIIEIVRISGKPLWWVIMLLVPPIFLVLIILVYHEIAKAFKKTDFFLVGLVFLPFIFWPILAFGKATYTKPAPAA